MPNRDTPPMIARHSHISGSCPVLIASIGLYCRTAGGFFSRLRLVLLEAIKTGQLPLMWLCLAIIGGVSLFGIGYQVPFAKSLGFGPFVAAVSAGVLALVNGLGRGVVGWLSDQMGRKQALISVLLVEAVAQFGLIWSGKSHNEVLFIIFAFVAGFGGGAFYPMFAALTPDYFGENNNASNYGLIYSAKLVGGFLGLGVASSVVTHIGYTGAYT